MPSKFLIFSLLTLMMQVSLTIVVQILNEFLRNEFKILVSTTIIEVGIDFPNANVIIIENANKFGLSQLHQLRGRVGRGNKESSCILMFKSNLSENAKKRINILKASNDGFEISEEDMKLRDITIYHHSITDA